MELLGITGVSNSDDCATTEDDPDSTDLFSDDFLKNELIDFPNEEDVDGSESVDFVVFVMLLEDPFEDRDSLFVDFVACPKVVDVMATRETLRRACLQAAECIFRDILARLQKLFTCKK